MKIQIDGVGTVEVGDDFAKMTPDAQNAFVAHISQQAASGAKSGMPGANLDKYQQAAQDDYEAAQKAGAPTIANPLMAKFTQGRMLGALPTVTAAMETPLEMIKRRTWNPVEGYNYAKAAENLAMQKAREQAGPLGTAAEIAGGIGTGAGLAGKGYTLVKPGQGLAARALASAGEGAGYGAVTGFNEGEGVEGRLKGALSGGLLGGAVGGAIPMAGAAIKAATAPIVSNISARMDPQGYAKGLLARALADSGKTPQELAQSVSDAAGAGQGVYTLADAMGKPGQELASTVARAPGEGQRVLADFLDNRQAGQARRITNALTEGFDAPKTARQTVADLTAARKKAADLNYNAARGTARAVDVTPAIDAIDKQVSPGVQGILNPGTEVGSDTVTGVLNRVRAMLTNGKQQLSDFDAALQTKKDIDAIIDSVNPTQKRALIQVRNALDDQLANASGPYANARNTFRQQSQQIEAVDQGTNAAMRGRHEDTIPAFNALSPGEQSTFRVGYADPLIEAANAAAPGANKARPLMSDAHQAEFPIFAAPGREQALQDKIARENAMFELRARALGGSKTADNLANAEAAGIDPRIFWNALHGNWGAAASNALHAGVNGLTGNTAPVRSELAQLLLRRGNNADIQPLLDEIRAGLLHKQRIGAGVTRGLLAGSGEMSGQRR